MNFMRLNWVQRPTLALMMGLIFMACQTQEDRDTDVTFTLSPEQLPEYEQDVDHAEIIEELDDSSYARGERIYQTICHSCHGNPFDEGSLPTALKFWNGKFKVGSDPYSMYQTMTRGFQTMPPQVTLVPLQKYDVIHYIREQFLRQNELEDYVEVDDDYLEDLPEGDLSGPEEELQTPWSDMDYGDFLIQTYEIADDSKPPIEMSSEGQPLPDEDFSNTNFAYKGIAIRLDSGRGGVSQGRAWMIFDQDLFRIAGGWTGEGFINWEGILLDGQHNISPRTKGALQFESTTMPGWANPTTGSFEDPRFQARDGRKFGPLPKTWATYKGLYHHNEHQILSYAIGSTNVLEELGVEYHEGQPVFTRTLNLENISRPLKLLVASDQVGVEVLGEGVVLDHEEGHHILKIPSGLSSDFKLLISKDRQILKGLKSKTVPAENLSLFTKAGDPHYPEVLTTKVRSMTQDGPFVVDVLEAPKENKWNSRLRMSGIDFFNNDNEAVVSCTEGDVWRVSGLKDPSGNISWRRIASGLFQPLGIKVVNEEIYVSCRDQIVLLKDLNGDGETDFYQNFNNDHQVTDHFHEFAMGLETDDQGNFYYAKSGRHAREALIPQHGTLLKVSQDGAETNVVATGFRAANGVCINPDGSFLVTDQEGYWNPQNRINWVRKDGFYGNMYGYDPPRSSADEDMEQPLCWVDREIDRSPAELVWVPESEWGTLGGSLLNLSYGYGRVLLVPYEEVNGQMQGSVIRLPIPDFPTGVMRGRFHPSDGHLYLCGMSAWGTQQMQEPGGLYRMRYTGEPIVLPVEIKALKTGVQLTFASELDKSTAEQLSSFEVKTWRLERSEEYGSDHFDEKKLKVEKAELASDGKTVMLTIRGMLPVWQMEIEYELKDINQKVTSGKVHSTVHNLGS